MPPTYPELLKLLTLEYFTEEQIKYIFLKLRDPTFHSFYLHSCMQSDIKKIKSLV